jgi:hypothetical protein
VSYRESKLKKEQGFVWFEFDFPLIRFFNEYSRHLHPDSLADISLVDYVIFFSVNGVSRQESYYTVLEF